MARREMRERSRSRGFRVSLLLMIVVVIAVIVVPGLVDHGATQRTVGVSGSTPQGLTAVLAGQRADGHTALTLHRYGSLEAGRAALRSNHIDALVVNGRRLEWRDRPDPALQTSITTAIQVAVVHQRAAALGIDAGAAATLLAPVPVTNTTIGAVPGGSTDNTAVAALLTVVLLGSIVIYGNLVLTGVVEEKATRVVEVLLARVPAKALLGGKVVGIGLLGFGQLAVTALAALLAKVAVDSVDLPAVTGGVLAWGVVWFVLGYALYAMVYGALGSLASRTEDAQNVAGPVSYLIIAGYWASLIAIGQDPNGIWSRLLSLFPATAPWAMPGRIALGAASWWEPPLAVALTVAAVAGLVSFAGRVYDNAVLHTGRTLKLREVWHVTPADDRTRQPTSGEKVTTMPPTPRSHVIWAVILTAVGILTAALLFAWTQDVIWTLVPILLTISAVRALLHRADTSSRHHTSTR